jgi:hypothetical protein
MRRFNFSIFFSDPAAAPGPGRSFRVRARFVVSRATTTAATEHSTLDLTVVACRLVPT